MKRTRTEEDLIGQITIDAENNFGINTVRASQNFADTGITISAEFIKAYIMVKKAALITNQSLGYISDKKASAIEQACSKYIETPISIPIDALQGGAGTSTNMAINELLANTALTLLGEQKGAYDIISPIEDVNMHQSTNDTYPTALKIAAIFKLRNLSKYTEKLQGAFQKKEKEFADLIKIGKTEMQYAHPMTLGKEFSAFAEAISRDRWRIFKCEERLRVINLGGTAIGTGLGAPRDYIFTVTENLRNITGIGLARSENLTDQTANSDLFVEVSGIIKTMATNLIKICNDLRGLHFAQEINLDQKQTGSSIMPGKVNPVIMENIIQISLKVLSNDFLISQAASRATYQINEFSPLLCHALLESLHILEKGIEKLTPHIDAITASKSVMNKVLNTSLSTITSFVPYIGYKKCEELIEEYKTENDKTLIFTDFLKEKLGEDKVNIILSPQKINAMGYNENNT